MCYGMAASERHTDGGPYASQLLLCASWYERDTVSGKGPQVDLAFAYHALPQHGRHLFAVSASATKVTQEDRYENLGLL